MYVKYYNIKRFPVVSSVYGIKWSIGDILTIVLDTNNKTIEYILNTKTKQRKKQHTTSNTPTTYNKQQIIYIYVSLFRHYMGLNGA